MAVPLPVLELTNLDERLRHEGLGGVDRAILEAGRRRLANQQMESFVAELRSLQQYLAQAVQANFTSRERIEWGYQQDLEKFSEVEKAKALRLAEGIGQRMAIESDTPVLVAGVRRGMTTGAPVSMTIANRAAGPSSSQ